MRVMPLCLGLLLAIGMPRLSAAEAGAASSHVAPKGKPAKSRKHPAAKRRTLAQLIKFAMAEGRDKTIDAETASNLGFSGELTTKAFRYKESVSPDGYEHAFCVVYEDSSGQPTPVALIWNVTKITTTDSSRTIEGPALRLSLDGGLERALTVAGTIGVEVTQTPVPIDSDEAKTWLEQETKFYLKDSLSLDMDK